MIKHPDIFKNDVEIIEEVEHGWNSHPQWKNGLGEVVGSPSSPWSLFIQEILADNIPPLVETVNDNISEDDDLGVVEWSLDKRKSQYVIWLIGYDIINTEITDKEIEDYLDKVDVSEKILFLEAAYHMLNKINKGRYFERFRNLINKLYKEVLTKNNKVLLKVIEEYRKDWDNI